MKTLKAKPSLRQDGFASIIIAIVLLLVLSLITVGFAGLSRKEQRSALDKQLNSQAYYAAETGLNDAAKALKEGFNVAKTECQAYTATGISSIVDPTGKSQNAARQYLKNNKVEASTGSNPTAASYPCLTIDPYPFSLEYKPVDSSQSRLVYLSGADPANPNLPPVPIDHLLISWQDSRTSAHTFVPGNGHDFTPAVDPGAWPSTNVLRIGLTPLTSLSRSGLISSTYSAFLYPNNKSSSPSTTLYSAAATGLSSGEILDGNCKEGSRNSTRLLDCNVILKDLNSANLKYLLSLRSAYDSQGRPIVVKIQAYGGADGNTQLRLKGAQTLVDSTGKAQDVLRRIQVRIPSENAYLHPDFDIESTGNICKQLELTKTTASGKSPECLLNGPDPARPITDPDRPRGDPKPRPNPGGDECDENPDVRKCRRGRGGSSTD